MFFKKCSTKKLTRKALIRPLTERINLYKFRWDKLGATRQKLQAQPKNKNSN